jgi:IS4 transposase
MKMLDQIPVLPGAWYIMDRGYLDFTRLWPIHQQNGWFVVRSKRHVNYRVVQSNSLPEPTKEIQITADQVVRFNTRWSRRSYPEALRRVSLFVEKEQRTLEVVTNNFEVDALDIAAFYKSRWKVELFFKWIKQHLRIRNFYGRSQNAVRCQIWSAICAYLMVAILKKQQKIEKSLYEVLQLVSVNPFETQPLEELLKAKPREQLKCDLQNCFVFNSN